MMHYDSMRNPVAPTAERSGPSRKAIESSQNFLSNNPYQEFDDQSIEQVKLTEMFEIVFIFILSIIILTGQRVAQGGNGKGEDRNGSWRFDYGGLYSGLERVSHSSVVCAVAKSIHEVNNKAVDIKFTVQL